MNALKLDCRDLRARSPRYTYLPVAESSRAVPVIDVTRPVRMRVERARLGQRSAVDAPGKFVALNMPFAGSVFVSNAERDRRHGVVAVPAVEHCRNVAAAREAVRAAQPVQRVVDAPGRGVARRRVVVGGRRPVMKRGGEAQREAVLVGEHVRRDVGEEVVRRPLPAAPQLVDQVRRRASSAASTDAGGPIGLLRAEVRRSPGTARRRCSAGPGRLMNRCHQ